MKLLHYYLLGAVDQFGPFTSLFPAHQSQTELRNPPLLLWQSFEVDHRPQVDVGNIDKGQDVDVDAPWGGACAYSHSHSHSHSHSYSSECFSDMHVQYRVYVQIHKAKIFTDSVLDAMIDMQVTLLGLG
jgi:hypothetical protein